MERDFTGRATPGLPVTDTVNRPTGSCVRAIQTYYENALSWNNDSLCTLAIAPGGQQVQYVYQSDFDRPRPPASAPTARCVRELATSAVDLNGDGVADVTDRSWHFDYDPRFGSDSTARKNMYDWIKASYDGLVPDGNGVAIKTKALAQTLTGLRWGGPASKAGRHGQRTNCSRWQRYGHQNERHRR